jgi:alpha-1,4-digalacturonate transport system substrate-binding protein
MQAEPGGNAIPGFMTQLTVTGPFINRTLFEQAGVPVPSDSSDQVTWQEWAEATRQVAEATGTFAMVDGSHRPSSGRPGGEHGRHLLQR